MLNKDNAVFIAIDFQEKLIVAMNNAAELEATTAKLCKGIDVMGIPKLVTTQYAKGLGPTTEAITEALGEFEPIDKATFSVFGNEEFMSAFKAIDKKQVIICGIEAHICLQQSALELIEMGYEVYVPADCISSRKEYDCQISIERMRAAGCIITTYESVLYELMKGSKAPEFKEISAIVK